MDCEKAETGKTKRAATAAIANANLRISSTFLPGSIPEDSPGTATLIGK
jgi:hypothetical protein